MPLAKLSADVIFSRSGSSVIDTRHDARPVRTDSFCTFPSGDAA